MNSLLPSATPPKYKPLQSCHLLTDFIQILQMFIIWDNDKLSDISGKLEMCLVESFAGWNFVSTPAPHPQNLNPPRARRSLTNFACTRPADHLQRVVDDDCAALT